MLQRYLRNSIRLAIGKTGYCKAGKSDQLRSLVENAIIPRVHGVGRGTAGPRDFRAKIDVVSSLFLFG